MSDHSLAIALARACTGGDQHVTAVATRLAATLGKPITNWLAQMANRYVEKFSVGVRPREREVLHFVLNDAAFIARIRSKSSGARQRRIRQQLSESPRMQPVAAASAWAVPAIESSGALAEWLGVSIGELEWFADLKGLVRKQPGSRLHHYHYKVLRKRSGGIRIIEAPQERLKQIQRQVLSGILEKVPQYYAAAHGFVKGRSVKSFAAPHVNKAMVLRIDLQNFFPTIGVLRVQALFRTMGYPETVADMLGGLCTNATPRSVFLKVPVLPGELTQHIAARTMYTRPHLPQGAPTSPLLANMCAYRLDCRLTALADWAGAAYTRYADDLVISGDGEFARNAHRYAAEVSAIAMSEGWTVQHHKTRLMRRGVRQHVAGVVVNDKLNVSRESLDALKATLTNCVRHGAESQNREQREDFRSHLRGRVAWITSVNEARGKRLQAIFDRIRWA